jgi:MFS family permease
MIAGHAALLAIKSGKPVKIIYDRMEVSKDGKILGGTIDFTIDGGAYTTLSLLCGPQTVPLLAVLFALAGIVVGVEEALEDSLAAELVPQAQHGLGFGTLAVNAVGDFISSAVIGLLWSAVSPSIAFGLSGLVFLSGTVLIVRIR